MITIKKLLIALVLFVFVSPGVFAKPRVDDIPLETFTQKTVYVPIGMGVKFTFPYILNDNDYDIPFSLLITNPLFKAAPDMGQEGLGSVNHFVVFVDPEKVSSFESLSPKIGNLFLNIAGHEITIELIGVKSSNKHYSDFNFTLSKESKEKIIQNLVRQRTKQLEDDYLEKIKKNEKFIDKAALVRLSEIMNNGLTYSAVNEKTSAVLTNGDKVTVLVEDLISSGKYTAIPFMVFVDDRAKTGVTINSARVFTPDDESISPFEIEGVFSYARRIEPGKPVKGLFVYSGKRYTEYNFNLLVDTKNLELTW